MIQLIHSLSPYCPFKSESRVRGVPIKSPFPQRRSRLALDRQRYYQVPIIKDGGNVIFETDANSQVIAKYLDDRLHLDLFPRKWAGVQNILWRTWKTTGRVHVQTERRALSGVRFGIGTPELHPLQRTKFGRIAFSNGSNTTTNSSRT
jgi:hypothetical protein